MEQHIGKRSVAIARRAPMILHVEDDEDLAALVRAAFAQFGFRGTMVTAGTVKHATQIVDEAQKRGELPDLVITDLRLPDGNGLELVRYIKNNPSWAVTPIIVLSSDADPQRVESAYVLGANSFITKSPSKRPLLDVVRSLYQHWLQDARLPGKRNPDRLQRILANIIATRGRHADFFTRMARELDLRNDELTFWLTAALRSSNLANLLSFVSNLTEAELPPDILDDLERLAQQLERDLDRVEQSLGRQPIASREDAYRAALDIETGVLVEPIARAAAHLFPKRPVVMGTLKDLVFANMSSVAGWIESHSTDPRSRERALQVRREAKRLDELFRSRLEDAKPAMPRERSLG